MPSLLEFCHEILHEILCQVYPEDLAALSASCRLLRNYIRDNRLLWRELYLQHFDCPPEKVIGKEDIGFWEEGLKRYCRLSKLLQSENKALKRAELVPASRTIIQLLNCAEPKSCTSLNFGFLTDLLSSQANLDIFIFSSSLYDHCGSDENEPHTTEEGRQRSAKLHSLFGVSRETLGRTRSRAAHPFARSRVYDLRRYTDGTAWGPFVDDGRFTTDWEMIEAIMIVLSFNLDAYSQRCRGAGDMTWNRPFAGVTPGSYESSSPAIGATHDDFVPLLELRHFHPAVAAVAVEASRPMLIPQPEPPLEAMDPYGVTGMWRRIVCFLDYSDFYAFNFAEHEDIAPDAPRPPITTQEAVRLIVMKVRVTKLERPGELDGPELPVVHFAGFSRSMHSAWDPNANSKLRGSVRLTPSGDVRWTTLSIFHGEARWRSEGIQVGGLRSARGVIGTWFDKDYDRNGPAGPTAFWKLTDALEEGIPRHPLPAEFQ